MLIKFISNFFFLLSIASYSINLFLATSTLFSTSERIFFLQYNNQNLILSSVGNISMKRLIKLIEKYFSNIPKSKILRKKIDFSNYKAKEVTSVRKGFQAHCILGREAYGVDHPKKTALILLNNILGGPGMNSRLNLAIREKFGFTYSIESNYSPYSDTGIFSIYLASDNNALKKSIQLTIKEIEKLCKKKLGVMQLKKAKKQLIGQIAISQENDMNFMLAMGKSVLYYNKVDTFEEVKEKVEAVNATELLEVANEILDTNNLSQLIYKL